MIMQGARSGVFGFGFGTGIVLASLVVLGCDSKVEQCRRLVDVANKHVDALTHTIEELGTLEDAPAVAARFETAIAATDADLAALEWSDPKVAEFAVAYRELLAELEQLRRAFLAVGHDEAERREYIETLERVTKLEGAVVQNVNGYCQTP